MATLAETDSTDPPGTRIRLRTRASPRASHKSGARVPKIRSAASLLPPGSREQLPCANNQSQGRMSSELLRARRCSRCSRSHARTFTPPNLRGHFGIRSSEIFAFFGAHRIQKTRLYLEQASKWGLISRNRPRKIEFRDLLYTRVTPPSHGTRAHIPKLCNPTPTHHHPHASMSMHAWCAPPTPTLTHHPPPTLVSTHTHTTHDSIYILGDPGFQNY